MGIAIEQMHLQRLIEIFDKYYYRFVPTDLNKISRYISTCKAKIDRGDFENPQALLTEPWSEFNFRHGANSVKGFVGEVLAVALLSVGGIRAYLNTGSYIEERVGADVYIAKPGKWSGIYTSQVKTCTSLSAPSAPDHWFASDPKYVNRLVLVDLFSHRMLQTDYPKFVKYFKVGDPIAYQLIKEKIDKTFINF